MAIYTLATYEVRRGEEEAFEAVQKVLQDSALTMEHPAQKGVLLRRLDRPQAYVSFGIWDRQEDAVAWRSSEGFAEAFGKVQELCDEVVAGPCEIVFEA